jgi:hypothetical protein
MRKSITIRDDEKDYGYFRFHASYDNGVACDNIQAKHSDDIEDIKEWRGLMTGLMVEEKHGYRVQDDLKCCVNCGQHDVDRYVLTDITICTVYNEPVEDTAICELFTW